MRHAAQEQATTELIVSPPEIAEAEPIRVLLTDDKIGYERWGLHGGGRMIIDWSRSLRDVGVDVTTVVLRDPGRLRQAVAREGLPFIFLSRSLYDPRTLWDLVSIIRQRRIQIVHAGGYGASTFGRLAAKITGIPCIVHVHADYRHTMMGYPWYVRWMDRLLVNSTDLVLLVSAAVTEFAVERQGFRPDQLEILHNPLDLDAFAPPLPEKRLAVRAELDVPPEVPVAICVARMEFVKGVDILVEAWKAVTARVPDAVLLLVGQGPLQRDLEQAASCMGCRSVRFLGYRPDVERVLCAADMAVMPSRSDAFPRAALEAMAIGLPVVATSVGGLPEIVRSGENGLVVPPENPEALAQALLLLLGDPCLRGRLGEGARESVQHLALPGAAARLEAIYRRLVRARRVNGARVAR